MRGATKGFIDGVKDLPDFNPRAHEGRDGVVNSPETFLKISIHAPMRGATKQDTDLMRAK